MKPQNRIQKAMLARVEIEPPVNVRTPARSRYTAQKYECKAGHVSEIIVEDRERLKTQKCRTCKKSAGHVYIKAAVNALPKSTIVYEKLEDGKMRRMYVDPKEPMSVGYAEKQGFQRREIQGMAAMKQFEREVTRDMKQEFAERMRGEHQRKQEFNEAYTSDLRAVANHPSIDPFTKEVIEAAIHDTSGGYQHREWDPEFHSAAYSG